jgi:hypothetical protein
MNKNYTALRWRRVHANNGLNAGNVILIFHAPYLHVILLDGKPLNQELTPEQKPVTQNLTRNKERKVKLPKKKRDPLSRKISSVRGLPEKIRYDWWREQD